MNVKFDNESKITQMKIDYFFVFVIVLVIPDRAGYSIVLKITISYRFMALTVVRVKVMPDGADIDLDELQQTASRLLEGNGASQLSASEEPVAFGLKALVFKFLWPEENGTEKVETLLSGIEGVSSVSIEDYRRAVE
ncbi:elongation factor 1-beta [Candidatus Pacearchaeota archaeon]|nr:MAG: elongation factor 1-beta [Candidatus Pacearchaeota archaeon]